MDGALGVRRCGLSEGACTAWMFLPLGMPLDRRLRCAAARLFRNPCPTILSCCGILLWYSFLRTLSRYFNYYCATLQGLKDAGEAADPMDYRRHRVRTSSSSSSPDRPVVCTTTEVEPLVMASATKGHWPHLAVVGERVAPFQASKPSKPSQESCAHTFQTPRLMLRKRLQCSSQCAVRMTAAKAAIRSLNSCSLQCIRIKNVVLQEYNRL